MTMHSDARELRNFGLIVGGIFCAIGVWPVAIRGLPTRWWAVTIGALLLIPAFVAPRSLGPVHRAWMSVGEVLGRINTRILLGIVFYGILTPMGLIKRFRGYDPMRLQYEPGTESYRIAKRSRSAAHMTRQF